MGLYGCEGRGCASEERISLLSLCTKRSRQLSVAGEKGKMRAEKKIKNVIVLNQTGYKFASRLTEISMRASIDANSTSGQFCFIAPDLGTLPPPFASLSPLTPLTPFHLAARSTSPIILNFAHQELHCLPTHAI
jgi:hypothetical protein